MFFRRQRYTYSFKSLSDQKWKNILKLNIRNYFIFVSRKYFNHVLLWLKTSKCCTCWNKGDPKLNKNVFSYLAHFFSGVNSFPSGHCTPWKHVIGFFVLLKFVTFLSLFFFILNPEQGLGGWRGLGKKQGVNQGPRSGPKFHRRF